MAAKAVPAADWEYTECATVEQAQAVLRKLAADPRALVTVDQNLGPLQLTGSDLIAWLTDLGFKGLIISASGDAGIGDIHRCLGAHLVWGKPIPTRDTILAQLEAHYRANPPPK